MRLLIVLGLGIAGILSPAGAGAAAQNEAPAADAAFARFSDEVVDQWLRLDPVAATQNAKAEVAGYLEFLRGKAAREIFERYGFTVLAAKPAS